MSYLGSNVPLFINIFIVRHIIKMENCYTSILLIKSRLAVKIWKNMNITDEEINPLDISFSNEKGFEPSTPSQTSPPVKQRPNQPSLHIRNPMELFAPSPARSPYPLRNFTPPSKSSQIDLMRFSTNRKESRKKDSSLTAYRKWVPSTDILLVA